jgi:hypothetical protein
VEYHERDVGTDQSDCTFARSVLINCDSMKPVLVCSALWAVAAATSFVSEEDGDQFEYEVATLSGEWVWKLHFDPHLFGVMAFFRGGWLVMKLLCFHDFTAWPCLPLNTAITVHCSNVRVAIRMCVGSSGDIHSGHEPLLAHPLLLVSCH